MDKRKSGRDQAKQPELPELPTRLAALGGKPIRLTEREALAWGGTPATWYDHQLYNPPKPLMPFAFWLSRRGACLPVLSHGDALALLPDIFGLARAPKSTADLMQATETVLRKGWMRGRLHPGGICQIATWVSGLREIDAIRGFVARQDQVIGILEIEALQARASWQFAAKDFLARKYPASFAPAESKAGKR